MRTDFTPPDEQGEFFLSTPVSGKVESDPPASACDLASATAFYIRKAPELI
jgi:hypothetical protein